MARTLGYLVIWLSVAVSSAYATYDPLAVPNNRIGIHILDPVEIGEAAKLVNSTGGQWGYVTVPIRSNDRDKDKWRMFFIKSRELKVIPILRLATYPIGNVWEKPTAYDLVDFANFLVDLPWPTTNRYIILFNEPNHDYEWGGEVSSLEYTNLLIDARQIFKGAAQDFFLLSAGLDMSVPNSKTSVDALAFYKQMFAYQPGWYDAVDGLAVHAYPNPAFTSTSRYGVRSYKYEEQLIRSYGLGEKPVFITETGTKSNQDFFPTVFSEVWTDRNIVAITPFLLFAGAGDFSAFSFLDTNHQPKPRYYHVLHHPKAAGSPQLAESTNEAGGGAVAILPGGTVVAPGAPQNWIYLWLRKLILGGEKRRLSVGDDDFEVEVADSPAERERGLSGRLELGQQAGMLFVFDSLGRYSFWMKDMNFPLDFVWIAKDRVIQVTTYVPAPDESDKWGQIVYPAQPVDWVLEINAGQVDALGIKIGDKVELMP